MARLTYVAGDRPVSELDTVSRKILAAGPKGRGRARTFGQDLMRGEHTVGDTSRRAADQRSNLTGNLTGAPPTPGWAQAIVGTENSATGTSIFDPVLCELAYRWFCPPGGLVLDPFAGGSVRGIVASKLGRRYLGIDLRAEQIAANEAQADRLCADPRPAWIVGDSRQLATLAPGTEADLVFSCPPYGDLEVYSDDPADLSTLDYPAFLEAYRAIIAAAVGLLAADRFACFVVGDIRDKQGFYRRFVSDTEQAFEDAGARLYNEAILITAVGSLPIRAGRQFEASRKLGKTHQNVLVFCKGDPKRATDAVGPVEFGEPAVDDAQP
jgi:DNA methylase